MDKNVKFVILAALLIIIMVLGVVLYPKLSQQYLGEITDVPDNSVPSETVISPETKENTGKTADKNTEKAADFTVYDTDGDPVSLSQMTGKPTIVNFWTTWCGYCVEELPTFDRYAKEYGDRINFMMVDLPDGYRETKDQALAFVESKGYDFPVYFDSDLSASDAYQIQSIPMTLLIDKDGYLYKVHIGLMNEAVLKQYTEILTESQ